ncbi:Conserved protein involved in Fe/S cluster assembly [Lactobacillus delbrueckii subsp. delbrueckii DSM 20074 = JCM 1012]|nr:Conserved protein involved in Fe/S cluster assembly [Lactobacillus delbrueckii subsp. delbrueckii DSM 20074 = JCM 1012]
MDWAMGMLSDGKILADYDSDLYGQGARAGMNVIAITIGDKHDDHDDDGDHGHGTKKEDAGRGVDFDQDGKQGQGSQKGIGELAEVAAGRAQLLDKTGFDHGSWISLSKKTKTIVQNGI